MRRASWTWWAGAAVLATTLGFVAGGCWERNRPIPAEELYFDPVRAEFRRAWDVDREPQYPVDRPRRVIPAAPVDDTNNEGK